MEKLATEKLVMGPYEQWGDDLQSLLQTCKCAAVDYIPPILDNSDRNLP